MKFEFLYDNGRQRFYKSSAPIKNGESVFRKIDVKNELQDFMTEYKLGKYPFLKDYVADIVCISDATTHDERLVFLGFQVPEAYLKEFGGDNYRWLNVQIGGQHTMMIDGGNPETIRDDKVYLRRLAILNKDVKP